MNSAKKAGLLVAAFTVAALTALSERQDILNWSVEHESPRTAAFAVKGLGADSRKALSRAIWNDSAAQVKFAVRTLQVDLEQPQNEWYSLTSARGFEKPGAWSAHGTMLMDAASLHHSAAARALIESGADVPAALNGALADPETMQGLMNAGIDPAIQGGALLYSAVHSFESDRLRETLRVLLNTGRFSKKQVRDALNEGMDAAIFTGDITKAKTLMAAGVTRADALKIYWRAMETFGPGHISRDMGRFLRTGQVAAPAPAR